MIEDIKNGSIKIVPLAEKRSELALTIDDEIKDYPDLQRHYAHRAKLFQTFFNELVENNGFTREEALRLTEAEFIE